MQTLRAFNIDQVFLNGKKYTAFKLYQGEEGLLGFKSNQFLKGHFNKAC